MNRLKKTMNLLKLKKKITNNLPLHCFTEDERISYGVTNNNFGDILFVINDKLAFSPNLFGFLKMKAYHGYLPLSNDNRGIFLYNKINIDLVNNEISSLDANKIIIESL